MIWLRVVCFSVQVFIDYNMGAQNALIALSCMAKDDDAARERTNALINHARGFEAKSPLVQRDKAVSPLVLRVLW